MTGVQTCALPISQGPTGESSGSNAWPCGQTHASVRACARACVCVCVLGQPRLAPGPLAFSRQAGGGVPAELGRGPSERPAAPGADVQRVELRTRFPLETTV